MSFAPLPIHMKALICEDVGQPLTLRTVETPSPTPGSCVVKVIAAAAEHNIPRLLSGKGGLTFPKHFCPGPRAIGRVAATGIDTTSLQVGLLVMLEPFIRARDDPGVQVIWGIYDGPTPTSKKFMADNWSMGTYAEYVRVPLENCYPLDEKTLCGSPADGGFGYTPYDLLQLPTQLVAYGGLRSIDVKPGETVIVAPATGLFSGAGVQVAVAMGANVIAMGRNLSVLQKLQASFPAGRIRVVQTRGNVEEDAAALKQWGPVDAYIDISPIAASGSTHVRSCLMALKQYGRACLMGVITSDLAMPYSLAVWNNLTIKGQYMYERENSRMLIKMAETGVLKLGRAGGIELVGQFGLEEAEKAFQAAEENREAGKLVILTP